MRKGLCTATLAPGDMVGEASKDFEAGNALENVLNIDLCLTEFDFPTGTRGLDTLGAEDSRENVDLG